MPKSDIPSHVARAIARGRGNAAQPRPAGPIQPNIAPHVLRAISGRGPAVAQARAVLPGVVQTASNPSFATQQKIEGTFRNWEYPIGGSSQKLAGGSGTYDVGAKVYDSGDNVIGSGEYSSGEMVHAEMAALDDALGSGYQLADVAKIRITKGCCRRCAVVMKMLGLADKVGPNTSSSTYSGAYKIPDNVRAALAGKLTLYTIDDMAWVVEQGDWW